MKGKTCDHCNFESFGICCLAIWEEGVRQVKRRVKPNQGCYMWEPKKENNDDTKRPNNKRAD
jgi:hypothetical protein